MKSVITLIFDVHHEYIQILLQMKRYQTQVYSFNSAEDLAIAHQKLSDGEVMAAPTDTVYGLMASLLFPAAIEQIYTIKERPKSKAIPLLIGDIEQLDQVAQLSRLGDKRAKMKALAEKWWPGPLTLILPANESLPQILTAGQSTVAVRIPDHDWLRQLLRTAGPLAATSANLSGQAETTEASAVLDQLAGRVSAIFDGGPCAGGMGSTIIDLTDLREGQPRLLRPGPLADAVRSYI